MSREEFEPNRRGSPDAGPLSKPELFAPSNRDAVAAVADELKRLGQIPDDYFVEVRADRGVDEFVIDAWHKDLLQPKYGGSRGDPTGKCRTFYYNARRARIVKQHRWR